MKQAKGHVPFLERAKILGNVRGLAHSYNDLPIPAELFLQLSTYLSHISGDNKLAMLELVLDATLLHEYRYRFFFFKQKTAYEIRLSLVGSEMCKRDSHFLGHGLRRRDIVEHDHCAGNASIG